MALDACVSLGGFVTVASSTRMNLKRRCPFPVQGRKSFEQREHEGWAVSHYNLVSLWRSDNVALVGMFYGPSSSVSGKHHSRVLRVLRAS